MRPHGIALILGLAVPAWAQAGSFQVSPVGLSLSAAHSTGVVTVTNNSNTVSVVQLQTVAWSQVNGDDVYTPSRELLATPPIFTLPAGGKQVVRLGFKGKVQGQQESAYRLFLQEVPPPAESGGAGLTVLLRVGIPVFVASVAAAAPELHWSAQHLSATDLRVAVVNQGGAHAHLGKLTLDSGPGGAPLAEQAGGYVLPGAQHAWVFKLEKPLADSAALSVTAETELGKLHAQLVPGK